MDALWAGLAGVLVVGGTLLIMAGFRSSAVRPQQSSTDLWTTLVDGRAGRFAREQGWRLAVAILAGVVAATATGWPLLLVLIPAGVVGLPVLLGQPANRELELLQALDRWVRALAAMLPTGRSITDAIRLSRRQSPAILAPGLALVVDRIDDRWSVQQALLAFADELGGADADAVLASLALAAQRGGTGAAATLAALADSIQDRLRALREIETERAKPRIVVRQVTMITLTVLAAAVLFGGSFFSPYGTPVGQAILAALISLYLGSLVLLRRMTLPRPRERILRRST